MLSGEKNLCSDLNNNCCINNDKNQNSCTQPSSLLSTGWPGTTLLALSDVFAGLQPQSQIML